jgi:hypothetical protein
VVQSQTLIEAAASLIENREIVSRVGHVLGRLVELSGPQIIDLDLRAYFDGVRHSLLLEKVARRIRYL